MPIHVLTGTRPERIQCLLYGRLITMTMLMRVCSYAAWYAAAVLRREISLRKLMLWLKRTGRFAHAIQDGTVETLCSDLRRDMAMLLCKQKRQWQTSQQLLEEHGYSKKNGAQEETTPTDQAAYLDAYGVEDPGQRVWPGRRLPSHQTGSHQLKARHTL